MTTAVPLSPSSTPAAICALVTCDVCHEARGDIEVGSNWICTNGTAKHRYCKVCYNLLPETFTCRLVGNGNNFTHERKGFLLQCVLCPFPRNRLTEAITEDTDRATLIHCPNTEHGCGKIKANTREQIAAHEASECLFVPVSCPALEGCATARRTLFEHLQLVHKLPFGGEMEKMFTHTFPLKKKAEPGFYFFQGAPTVVRMARTDEGGFAFWVEQDKEVRPRASLLWVGLSHPSQVRRCKHVSSADFGTCLKETVKPRYSFLLTAPEVSALQEHDENNVGNHSNGITIFFSLDPPGRKSNTS